MLRKTWKKMNTPKIRLVAALIIFSLASLTGIALAQAPAQAFSKIEVSSVRGSRVLIWTAAQPSGFRFIIGLTYVCTANPCNPGSGFFETGYVKGTITPVQNQLQQYAAWANVNGDVVNKFGLGNLSDNSWYQFQALFSKSAQRWEAWRGSQVVWFEYGLNFTSGVIVGCGAEGGNAGAPLGVECNSMQYKVGSEPWTLYNYTGTDITGPYCVFKRIEHNAVHWGPC